MLNRNAAQRQVLVVVAVLLVATLTAVACGGGDSAAPTATASPTLPPPTVTPTATATPLPFEGRPVRIRIPVLGVDAPIEEHGVNAEGALDAPHDERNAVAWYPAYGAPATPGHAFFSAFNYSGGQPGPFEKLFTLRAGDEVLLIDGRGGTARYRVRDVQRYQKAGIPFGDILLAKAKPEGAGWITLLTEGGELAADGNYVAYEVVVAETR